MNKECCSCKHFKPINNDSNAICKFWDLPTHMKNVCSEYKKQDWFRITYMDPNGGASRVVIANDVQDAIRKAEINETELDTGIRIEKNGVWCAEKYQGKWSYKKKYYILFNHTFTIAIEPSLEDAMKRADELTKYCDHPLTGLFISDENDKTLACRLTKHNYYWPKNPEPDKDIITWAMSTSYLGEWNIESA